MIERETRKIDPDARWRNFKPSGNQESAAPRIRILTRGIQQARRAERRSYTRALALARKRGNGRS